MSTAQLDNSLLRITVQFRSDIEWVLHAEHLRWVARDPISSAFYYFSDVEHSATQLLDGHRNLADVLRELTRRFPSKPLHWAWLVQLVSKLRAAELLIPENSASSARLLRPNRHPAFHAIARTLLSPLSIRVPLFDPTQWLQPLRWPAAVLFHPMTMLVCCVSAILLLLTVVGAILSRPHSLMLDLSTIQGDRWLLVLGCYLLVKSFHELGHALACLHWRAACTEIGLLFLFFTPCLYCDTTDAWKLRSRWQRAAISFAGIYVELIIASLAAIIWLSTRDGLAHSLAANVMLVCSIDTFLVNANPLLKYDGYYMLSDLWGVPNLSDQGREASWSILRGFLTASAPQQDHLDRNVWCLAIYSLAALIYRTLVLFAILWLAWFFLNPLGLGFLALSIYATTAVGIVLAFKRVLQRLIGESWMNSAVRFSRLIIVYGLLVSLVLSAWLVPIPHHVVARAISDYADKTPLFAKSTSQLLQCVEPDSQVTQGQNVFTLDAPEKRLELIAVRGEIQLLDEKRQQLKRLAVDDPKTAFELPTLAELSAELQAKEQLLSHDLAALQFAAPQDGWFLPSTLRLASPLAAARDTRRSEIPTASNNIGCTLERGASLGWFSARQVPILIALVAAEDVKRITVGMRTECQWDGQPGRILLGVVERIAPDPLQKTPEELLGDEAFISIRNDRGEFAPELPHYEVQIRLSDSSYKPIKSSLATIRFSMAPRTVWQAAIEFARQSWKPPK